MTQTAAAHPVQLSYCSPEGCCCGKRELLPDLWWRLALCSPSTPHPANLPRPRPRLRPVLPAILTIPTSSSCRNHAPLAPGDQPAPPLSRRRNSGITQCFKSTKQQPGFASAAPSGLEQRLSARPGSHSCSPEDRSCDGGRGEEILQRRRLTLPSYAPPAGTVGNAPLEQ